MEKLQYTSKYHVNIINDKIMSSKLKLYCFDKELNFFLFFQMRMQKLSIVFIGGTVLCR